MSATFSYVSPAARAACFDKKKSRSSSAEKSPGQLHLIDGGYNNNYGVASALDWLSAALEAQDKERLKAPDKKRLTVSRVALVEFELNRTYQRKQLKTNGVAPGWDRSGDCSVHGDTLNGHRMIGP